MADKKIADAELVEEIIRRADSPEGVAMAEGVIERIKKEGIPADQRVFDFREHDIMKVLNASYIAERFFGRSRSWICHKLNHDIVNGKPADFTAAERQKLKEALDTIAYEIQILSDNI
jgi:hypothetical protein